MTVLRLWPALVWPLVLGCLVAALSWVLLAWQPGAERPTLAAPPAGGDFSLMAAEGPLSLADLRGQVAVLFFGYTQCPDVCPTGLAWLALALHELPAEQQERVTGVFISVDPDRDSPERLAAYTEYFHPRIIGVTGSAAELERVAGQYGAAYHRVAGDSALGYLIDHSAFYYVLDPEGVLVGILPHGSSAAELGAAIQDLLTQ